MFGRVTVSRGALEDGGEDVVEVIWTSSLVCHRHPDDQWAQRYRPPHCHSNGTHRFLLPGQLPRAVSLQHQEHLGGPRVESVDGEQIQQDVRLHLVVLLEEQLELRQESGWAEGGQGVTIQSSVGSASYQTRSGRSELLTPGGASLPGAGGRLSRKAS